MGQNGGTGSLTIQAGGTVSSITTNIGYQSGSTGTVNLHGTLNTAALNVGRVGGTASLTIHPGGELNNSSSQIGTNAGSVGTVDVAGGTWNGGDSVDLGAAGGGGTLTIRDGGIATLGRVSLSNSTLNIGNGGAAGVLNTTSIDGFNTAAIHFDHSAADHHFTTNGTSSGTAVAITGSTSVNQTGSGKTTLSGTNTYSGGTIITNGTLQGTVDSLIGNIANEGALIFDQTFAGTYSGIVSGTGSLTKTGAGVLTQSGSNTYTGVTRIDAGILALGSSGALGGNGDVTFGGGALRYLPSITTDLSGRIVNSSSAIAIDTNGGSIAFASALASSNTGGLTKTGSGSLTLSAANAYTGTTTITAGDLAVANRTALYNGTTGSWTAENLVVASGARAILNVGGTGEFTSADLAVIGGLGTAGGGFKSGSVLALDTTNAVGGTFTASDSITNTNNVKLQKLGTGTLVLSGTNTYTGGTIITAGTLRGDVASIKGNISNASALIFDQGTDANFTNAISGDGTLTKSGAGILTLSAVTTYTGTTTIGAGTLRLGNDNVLANATAVTVSSGASFDVNGHTDIIGSLAGAGSVTLGAGALTAGGDNSTTTFSGPVSGTGGFTKAGTGALTFSGSTDYSGGTTLSAGTLNLGHATDTLSDSGAVIVVSGTLALGSNSDTVGAVTLSGGSITGPGTLTAPSYALTDSGTISANLAGAGGITKSGAGTAILSGTNSYGGGIVISAGTLQGNVASLKGNIANDGALIFDQATDASFTNSISGAGSLAKEGVGTLTLSSANSHAGGTTLSAGTLALDHSGALGSSGSLTFNGGTLQFSANNTTDYSSRFSTAASQKFNFDTNGQNVTLANALTGSSGTLTKTGAGNLTVSGINTYTGVTTISGGNLTVGAGGSITSTSLFAVGRFSGDVGSLSVAATGTISNSIAFIGLAAGSQGSAEIAGTWTTSGTTFTIGGSGTGSLTIQNGGVVTRAVTNPLVRLAVQAGSQGTLTISGSTSPGVLNTASINGELGNAVINFDHSASDYHFTSNGTSSGNAVAITGSTSVNHLGTGTTTLSGTNTYSGATTVSNGTLVINGALASTSIAVAGSLAGSGVMANATLSGSGSINPGNSSGILTAAATDPTGGLAYNFEFRVADSLPDWDSPTASGNDVLRLSGPAPFSASLDAANSIAIHLSAGPLAIGQVFTGGFYTDANSDFLSSITSATFTYLIAESGGAILYNGTYYEVYDGPLEFNVSTVLQTADFGAGEINGFTTRFTIVPEPSSLLLGLFSGVALALRRRRA